jgi:parallel beta-helix repeat protein
MTSLRRSLTVLLPLACALLLLLLTISPPPASAAAFRVCPGGAPAGCTWSTIQAAVTGAYDGAEILVSEGAYLENVVITKSVILSGGWKADFSVRDWDRYLTVINGRRLGTVVRVEGSASPTLEGFVITNGDASSPLGWGGGILVYHKASAAPGPVVIRHNVISDNIASSGSGQGFGGGVMVYGSKVLLDQNTIIGNWARTGGSGGGHGGGVAAWGWDSVFTATSNIVLSNTAMYSTTSTWAGEGGGIWVDSVSQALLTGNEMSHNVAAGKGAGYGGGIYATGEVRGNRIISNTASLTGPGYGGGIFAYYTPHLDDNLVQDNVAAAAGDGTGGGIYANQMQWAGGNTIVGNTATRGGGFYLGSGTGITLRDNTITGNHATGGPASTNGGGGIATVNRDALIDGNTITGNTAAYFGGGILAAGGAYRIEGNTVRQNASEFGGGIFLVSSAGSVNGNLVLSNTANTRGGGINVWTNVTATLDANQVLGNMAVTGQGGGMVVKANASPVTVTNHMIARNGANVAAGGIFLDAASVVRLTNNTIVDNDFGAGKEGVVLVNATKMAATNNLLVGHSIGISVSASTLVHSNNDYWENGAALAGAVTGTHEIFLNPSFVGRASGDYHLALTSAVIDQGDGTTFPPFDFEGDPRPRGAGVDVGADEVYRTSSYVSDLAGDDAGHDGSPGNPFRTVTKGVRETQTGGTVYVGRGTYTECITVTRGVALLGGYREGDWTRNPVSFVSTLNGAGHGTVVLIDGAGVRAKVDGFRITGGNASALGGSGGGVVVIGGAGATISSNRIDGNLAQNAGAGILVDTESGQPSTIIFNAIYNNRALGQFELPPGGLAGLQPQQGPEPGGGVLLFGGPITFTNNLVYSNTSTMGGDGLAILNGGAETVRLYHNTLADNGGITSTAVYLSAEGPVYLMNNLIVGYGTAITGGGTAGAILADYNGFWSNAHTYGPSLAPGAHDVTGDPLFANRAGRDYHIALSSPMAGTGVDLGVLLDYDGHARPLPAGTMPDIGAYEVSQRRVYLPLVMRN